MERDPLLKSGSAESISASYGHTPNAARGMEGAQRSRRSSQQGGGLLDSLGSASTRQYLAGVALLLGVVTLWSLSDFISAALQTGDHAWNKPFLYDLFLYTRDEVWSSQAASRVDVRGR